MRVLVIGSGGREHALVWKIAQSALVDKIFTAPGNGGTQSQGAINTPLADNDIDALAAFVRKEKIDLVVPGPELPLTLGITDRMRAQGTACFGPDAYGARIEGSKAFAKEIMARTHVPTASSAVFSDARSAQSHARKMGAPLVIKADGLAAGKGVVVARTDEQIRQAINDIMTARTFGPAGDRVVMEEFLEGEEVSLLCFCDGKNAVPLPSAQDHKAARDNDQGPNTGGMGAYSPAPILDDNGLEKMTDIAVRPVLKELAAQGHPFVGVLYAGLMMTASGPRVLEYNARFGDPECQPLLMRMRGDIVRIMLDCINGKLDPNSVVCSGQTALGVVLAAKGYPGDYSRGHVITGIDRAEATTGGIKVFHGGTTVRGDALVSNGGRVLCVTALGDDLEQARKNAYAAMERIRMPDSFYRTDIGIKGIRHLAGQEG
ncbi:MAG: phosphoribosylamine--glycine ligase [Desulfovibrio sp.]|nr:phosphoribosylamine--glycine ligase [Desulfovibrio sp.]